MLFRELRIEASRAAKDRDLIPSDLVFRWTGHHVREIFTALLPRGFSLDGSSVVQIDFGPRTEKERYQSVLKSSLYFVEAFDFVAYAKASPHDRELILLAAVETALLDIASMAGTDPAAIIATAQAVRDCGFKLEREVTRLKKRLPGSSHLVRVFRCLSAEEGETWRMRCFDARGNLGCTEVMGESPDYLNRRDFFHSAKVSGNQYLVHDRLGKETFCFRDLSDSNWANA